MARGALLILCLAFALLAQSPGEWSHYGAGPGGTRYSALEQINRENVTQLNAAWTYRTGETGEQGAARKAAFEATPILIDGTLYLSTPFNRVIALDAVSGREVWVYDPKVNRKASYSEVTSRGVAHWKGEGSGTCASRILEGTIDARLIALDAKTGKPCQDFGAWGVVDLTAGMRVRNKGDYQVTSPPAIVGDAVVVGTSIGDNRATDVEKGTVRAYHARTGKQLWTWDPIPADLDAGAANVWSVISADTERGLVFLPTSSPSPDFYGGKRKGDNRHANSVVALRADSGELVWGFQVVHHDLWDYDIASQPTLTDFNSAPAVVVTTKMGHIFVLHRETGKPLVPVEERRVPQSTEEGEHPSPTQPFSALPALVPQRLRPEDAWGVNEAERKWCADRIRELKWEGMFTPPSVQGTLAFPGNAGGVAWGGAAYDPKRGFLIVNTNRIPFAIKLIPRDGFDRARKEGQQNRMRGEFAPQHGTPFAMYREPLLAPSGLLCNAPPWGTLSALDLAGRSIKWEVPLGTMGGQAGSIGFGGPIVTGGSLIFIAATMDNHLRAFDLETGKELWKSELPASAQATPMTYLAGGKQFVVVAAGGHGKLGTKRGDYVVAYALP